MEEKKKKKRFSIKLIVASLLAVIVVVNLVHSTLQQVEAKGMFGNVEQKIKDIQNSTDKKLKVLEILPDNSSLSVMEMLIGVESQRTTTASKSFQEMLADYTSEEIEAFAQILNKYGMINMDSTSSAIYPLTYYKPGDEERIYSNTPTLPNPEEQKGYALVEQQLAVGHYEEIDVESIKAAGATGAEIVYYQEIVPTATPSPVPTQEATASTPTLTKETRESVMVATAAGNTVAQESTASTPSEDEATRPYFINEEGEKVYLTYNEEGFNTSIFDGTAKEGRFFRFIADEAGNAVQTISTTGVTYDGYGYRFIFGSKAEIRVNNLFSRFVLGISEDGNNENGSEITAFNTNNISLQTISIEDLGQKIGDADAYDLSNYDLVYIANPFLYWDSTEEVIKQYAYANPDLTEAEKAGQYSQWVMLAGARDNDLMQVAAEKLLEGAVNESTPLKLIVDSSVLKEYERAVSDYTTLLETLATDMTLAESATIASDSLDIINGSQAYKALLMLAQDDFDSRIRTICNATAVEGSELHVYDLIQDSDTVENWSDISCEDLRAELYAKDSAGENYITFFGKTNGHFVNKNLYFYNHATSDYKSSNLTQNGLSVVQMVNGDFRSILTKSMLRLGFTDVVTAIEDENRRNEYLENNREAINAEEISVDVIIQYLLNYEGKTIEIKKNTISVLEIQPCADFDYTYNSDGTQTAKQKEFIEKWIKYFAEEDRYQDVYFTSMSMQEFIGKNEDLNATYDMIYIGSNIGKFQTVDNDGETRRFNDTSMNGLIYTHVGDLVGDAVDGATGESRKDVLKGLLDTDYANQNRASSYISTAVSARTTGNDLTTYKKRDLLNFLESGYPIIVAEELLAYDYTGTPVAINAKGESASKPSVTPAVSGTVTPTVSGTVTPTIKPTNSPTPEPTNSPTPVPTTVKVYIRKAESLNQYDKVYLHLWNNSGATTSGHGIQCNYLGYNGGNYWYTVEFEKSKNYTSFQIVGIDGAGGEHRTSDQTLISGDVITLELNSDESVNKLSGNYCPSNLTSSASINTPKMAVEERTTVAAANTVEEKAPVAANTTGLTVEDTATIDATGRRILYIKVPTNGWSTVNVHMYSDSGGGTTWPGKQATKLGTEGGYNWYFVYVSKSYDKIILNSNGSSQTAIKTLGSDDVYTVTLSGSSISDPVSGTTCTLQIPVAENPTVDNSTYLYQLLKIATAQEGTVDVSKVTLDTLNSDDVITSAYFDWEARTYKNLLVDNMTDSDASAAISQFLNETKIYINLTARPKDYGYELAEGVAGKPIGTVTPMPGETTSSGKMAVNYLEPDAEGRYTLSYEFSISTLAGSLNEKDFDCKLLVDANFDGKFSENSEVLDSIVIKEASTGKIVSKTDGEDFYRLQEGVAYTLNRKLPKSFDGCINWKLQISQNGNEEIIAAETGYCAIPVAAKADDGTVLGTGEKQTIKILQITSGSDTTEYGSRKNFAGTHVNLEQRIASGNTSDAWHNLLTNIPDFKLEIKTVSALDFAKACRSYDIANPSNLGKYPEKQDYDMIIVGFIDSYADVYDGTTQIGQYMSEALIQFGNAGKSILFTHDTTAWMGDYRHLLGSSKSGSNYNSAYLTIAIRDLCGNDQFGLATRLTNKSSGTSDSTNYINEFFNTPASTGKSYSKGSTEWNDLLSLGKDMAFAPNSGQTKVVGETQGSTYVNLRLANYDFGSGTGTGKAETYVQYVKNLIPDAAGKNTNLFDENVNTTEKMDIAKINDGAITKYPYELKDEMVVNSTHSQYWTVDIESDTNGDNESDLVVWYCINGRNSKGAGTDLIDYYEKSPNDVRNNYYIYNKGNITYTGAGHTPFSGEDEIKLFINTMIAAYNAQLRVPEIYIVENGEPEADDLESLIIPYDSGITPEELGNDFVNFGSTTNSSSEISGTMKVFFNVYDGNLTAKNKSIQVDEIFITDSRATTTNANYEDMNGNAMKGHTYTMSRNSAGSTEIDTTNGVLPIYDAETDEIVDYNALVSGKSYYVKAPLGTIFAADYSIELHITMHTNIGEQKTATATDKLTISRAQIFDLD